MSETIKLITIPPMLQTKWIQDSGTGVLILEQFATSHHIICG